MSKRLLDDWLKSYVEYADITEAPTKLHFWSGIAALAGALRRKVWIDQVTFKWYANLYIIFVANPGIVSKTTTMNMALKLLRKIPGINFGPDVVTWPALVSAFAASSESFQFGEEWFPMSALTLASDEMGSLIKMADPDMINLYIDLWDGKDTYKKVTKTSGSDLIEGVWINMICCTTPQWLQETMPAVAVGGGFTSRCIFLHASEKVRLIPFVDEVVRPDHMERQAQLQHDLEYISLNLAGPVRISKEARDWYRPVYADFWRTIKDTMDTKTLQGYAARKQTMLFKTAMILSISRCDDLLISLEDVQLAYVMLEGVEEDMRKVFAHIGKSEQSVEAERFIEFVKRKGSVSYEEAYKQVHQAFPDFRDFEGMLSGSIRSGQIDMRSTPTGFVLVFVA